MLLVLEKGKMLFNELENFSGAHASASLSDPEMEDILPLEFLVQQ